MSTTRHPSSPCAAARGSTPSGFRVHARSPSQGRRATCTPSTIRPTNPDGTAPADELPPYLVLCTAGRRRTCPGDASAAVAYFTSRGIGVLDVNYGGSTGYGRGYRERLNGQWGIVDVEDVAAAARGLADGRPRPIGARLAIKGGSAGGWTVLCALANTDVFAAGHQPIRRRGPPRPRRGHPRLRGALPRSPRRPAARGRGPVHRAIPAHRMRTGCARRC